MVTESHNGILLVDKEEGYTSNDVVALIRKYLHMKKVGHTGTLDPAATGLLPVCVGRGTSLVNLITDKDKEYLCTMRFGITTDTEDMTGQVISTADPDFLTEAAVRDIIMGFVGEYDQVPPMYSAKKIKGKKLYEYAREGRVIERKPCRVHIIKIDIRNIALPEVEFTVRCSKGTYIRSLCRDIGERAACGAAMKTLRRTGVGSFKAADAHKLESIKEMAEKGDIKDLILPVEGFFKDCPAFIAEDQRRDKAIANGNALKIRGMADGRYRVFLNDGTFAAVYDFKNGEGKLCGYFLT